METFAGRALAQCGEPQGWQRRRHLPPSSLLAPCLNPCFLWRWVSGTLNCPKQDDIVILVFPES